MSAYPNVKFLKSAHRPDQFVAEAGVEVAVAGRSNSGKSSAINSIVQRKGLAKTSKTPGATRLVNFFELAPGRRLVDLPGYGYAAVPGEMRRHWGELLRSYFEDRGSLRGTIIVMDLRHALAEYDEQMIALATARGLPAHLLLTKADKLGRGAGAQVLASVRRRVGAGVTAQLFSSLTGVGAGEARAALERMLHGARKETPTGPAGPVGAQEPGIGG